MFTRNSNITLTASRTPGKGKKSQYRRTIVLGYALCQFNSLSLDIERTKILNVDDIIKSSAQYFPHVNSLSKQKRTMRRGMKKTREITVRSYAARLIDLNAYLSSFTEENLNDKIGVNKLN